MSLITASNFTCTVQLQELKPRVAKLLTTAVQYEMLLKFIISRTREGKAEILAQELEYN